MTIPELRALAMALPGSEEAPHFQYSSFRVGGRIYATVPPEGDRVHLFVDPTLGDGVAGCTPLSWGAKVVGLRVELAVAEREVLTRLLALAWRKRAPRRVQAQFDGG